MRRFTTEERRKALESRRFSVLAEAGVRAKDFQRRNPKLAREPRLLVPVDVAALVVRPGDERMVRLPFRDGGDADVMGAPDDEGQRRAPGVHLLWAVPEGFGQGTLVDDPAAPDDPDRRFLDFPALPDRWVVLRLTVPPGATQAVARGWVLEADSASITPLEDWPDDRTRTVTVGPEVPAHRLNVHVGGPAWMRCYDAALGRLAFHDPLDDLDTVDSDTISYVVAGWWSDRGLDPLAGVGSVFGYHERLAAMGWNDPDHPASTEAAELTQRQVEEAVVTRTDDAPRVSEAFAAQLLDQSVARIANNGFLTEAQLLALKPPPPTRATLLHGRIHGVPLRSRVRPDDRPRPDTVGVALGPSGASVAALVASGAVTAGADDADQQDAERLLTAFSTGLLNRIEQPDVWPDVDQYEHAQAFGAEPGGIEARDRVVDRPASGVDPGAGTRAKGATVQQAPVTLASNILWSPKAAPAILRGVHGSSPKKLIEQVRLEPPAPIAREVERPATPFYTPVAPVMAITGAGRRIPAAERDEGDQVLPVRVAGQAACGLSGLYEGRDLLDTVGSGAIPDEVLGLAREALAEDPYLAEWRGDRLRLRGDDDRAARARIAAESAINYAWYAGDDERLSRFAGLPILSAAARQYATESLLKHSLCTGVWAPTEGVTMWGQPWRPQFCEWTVQLDLAGLGDLDKWQLDEIDLAQRRPFDGGADVRTITGRSPLVTSVANALAAAIDTWLDDERARDRAGHGLASPRVEAAMAELQGHLEALDVLSVTLDGLRERLLGLRYDRGLIRRTENAAEDGRERAVAEALPRLILAGRLRVVQARLVDSFGRTLDLPVADAHVVARVREPEQPATLRLAPRITAPARLRLRLVDPHTLDDSAATAFVDQASPTNQVNPVAGFLLPDHIDEALEMFATDGTPLGQVSHDGFSNAVFWEGAPGRVDIGPDAGPLDDPDPTRRRLGWIAASLVEVDATARQARPARPETESPLSAMLRAIDTTLWTVDPLGALGREHIAGLVGRPIAVVTAQLTLDVLTDLDDLVYADGVDRAARARAFAELAAVPFSVRLGSATRNDDGLLAYYVDDDYRRLHLVDRAIATLARDSGRCRGHLGVDGDRVRPIDHPFVVTDGTLTIRHGQTIRLTLLMHPGGKVHVSGGFVPRTRVALAREWTHGGLSVMAPSVRVGPLLIDADTVRLPKVAAFPADQLFTRRDSPASWRDDPILAATQAAYLPDQASTVQEGWVRIAPTPKD